MKLSWGTRCAIGRTRSPQAKARRNERDRAMRQPDKQTMAELRAAGILPVAYSRQPPDHVIAERDAALAAGYRDITAAQCGDPLPGRSALDRRREAMRNGA